MQQRAHDIIRLTRSAWHNGQAPAHERCPTPVPLRPVNGLGQTAPVQRVQPAL